MSVDSNFHGIVAGSSYHMRDINNFVYHRGVSSLKMMEQKGGFKSFGFIMPINHFLIDEYNELIRRLRDAGITDYWYKALRRDEKITALGPQVLDMDHLEVCFYVCMIPLVAAFVCFVCELAWAHKKCCSRFYIQCMKTYQKHKLELEKRKKIRKKKVCRPKKKKVAILKPKIPNRPRRKLKLKKVKMLQTKKGVIMTKPKCTRLKQLEIVF